MRAAVLAVVAACGGSQAAAPVAAVAAPHPDAVFRWALAPGPCQGDRSGADRCIGHDLMPFLAVAYAPGDDDPRVPVLRYEGAHAGAPMHWQQLVDLGRGAHDPIVLAMRDAVVVAAIANAAVRIAFLDPDTGRVVASRVMAERRARAVQLDADGSWLSVQVRFEGGGGGVAVVDAFEGRIVATRVVAARSIHETLEPRGDPARASIDNAGGFSLAWDRGRLVASSSEGWSSTLHTATPADSVMETRLTLHVAGARAVATLHDPVREKHEAIAFDAETGAPLWRREIGLPRTSLPAAISTLIDGDELVVQSAAGASTVCTIGIADGVPRACVELAPEPGAERFDF